MPTEIKAVSCKNLSEKDEHTTHNKSIPSIGKKIEIKDFFSLKSDSGTTGVFGYPNDATPITAYGTHLYGMEWDYERKMWRIRWRFDWYQAKRAEPFGGSGWDRDPYVVLQVDLHIKEKGIVENSGRAFGYGGWNVIRRDTGNFEKIASVVCSAVISFFPTWYQLTFATGIELAKALRDAPPSPSYTWMGKQIKEASGFYQYDCYVYPDTDMEINFSLHFWGSSLDRGYQEYTMWWVWKGHTPTGPPKLEIEPSFHSFGNVKVGEVRTKTFVLTNTGGFTAIIKNVSIIGSSDFKEVSGLISGYLPPGEKEEIVVEFRPSSYSTQTAVLKVDSENCEDVSAILIGRGVKKNTANTILSNPTHRVSILINLIDKILSWIRILQWCLPYG